MNQRCSCKCVLPFFATFKVSLDFAWLSAVVPGSPRLSLVFIVCAGRARRSPPVFPGFLCIFGPICEFLNIVFVVAFRATCATCSEKALRFGCVCYNISFVFQFQHERVLTVAAIATRLAAAEILAGVRRWGFESDAAAMAAEAETICLCQGSRLAQRVCVVCSHGPGACRRSYGKETAASRGRRCSRFCWKRASASLVAAPARPTARAALLPLGVPATSRFWMEEATTSFWHLHASGQLVAHAFRCTTAAT